MYADLQRKQQGEQFRVLDPANLPDKPSFPNRPLFAAGGLGGGLALGLGHRVPPRNERLVAEDGTGCRVRTAASRAGDDSGN